MIRSVVDDTVRQSHHLFAARPGWLRHLAWHLAWHLASLSPAKPCLPCLAPFDRSLAQPHAPHAIEGRLEVKGYTVPHVI